jgi:hypothetical protein
MTSKEECKNFATMHLLHSEQTWVPFGGLGADLSRGDLLKKRESAYQTRMYSFSVRELNKKTLSFTSKLKNLTDIIPQTPTIRQKALEFAKSIPRPSRKAQSAPKRIDPVGSHTAFDNPRVPSLKSRFTELNLSVQEIRNRYRM